MNLELIYKCVDYILTSEHDDFYENPSDNHIYYWACIAHRGQDYADKELERAYCNLE